MNYLKVIDELKSCQTEAQLEAFFYRLAEAVLNHAELRIGSEAYEVLEVEAYYRSPMMHDPFIHRNDRQLHANQWYFHRKGSGLKGGNYQGLDLTFGDGKAWGGLLLRDVRKKGEEPVGGPSLLVDEIVRMLGANGLRNIVEELESLSVNNPNNKVQLVPSAKSDSKDITCSPRYGLTLAEEELELRKLFIMRPYRYRVEAHLTDKDRHTIFLALLYQGMEQDKALQLTGINPKKALAYFEHFKRGQNHRDVPVWKKRPPVLKHCELMGALLPPIRHK